MRPNPACSTDSLLPSRLLDHLEHLAVAWSPISRMRIWELLAFWRYMASWCSIDGLNNDASMMANGLNMVNDAQHCLTPFLGMVNPIIYHGIWSILNRSQSRQGNTTSYWIQ